MSCPPAKSFLDKEMNNFSLNLFCPRCQTYIGPTARLCSCGWERPDRERLPEPGQPLWTARLGGAVHGALVVGDLVIFHYGERNGKGGVCAFERETGKRSWNFETPHSVEGGVVHFDGNLYFATIGFLQSGAELYCLRLENGQQSWSQSIGAGVWCKPFVEEARLYIAQEDGSLRGFDSHTGSPIHHEAVSLPRGKVWLEQVDQAIIALSKSGQALSLNPQGLSPLWNKPYEVGCESTSAPCRVGKKLFFGARDGQVIALDTQARKHSIFATGLERVVAAPTYSRGRLFVGAHDHLLHAFDLGSGQELWRSKEFEHSLSSAPFAAEGFVVACINKSGVVLFDAQTGELGWHFPVHQAVQLMSDPLLVDGVIYAGTDMGQVFALPWHLGKYEWAGNWCRAREECEEAGMFFVLCAQSALISEKQEHYYQLAEKCWDAIGQSEWAARMWEGLARQKRAADAYCRAAESHRGRNNRQAAEYYYSASRLYWRLDEMSAQADHCAKEAASLGRWPDIRLKVWNNPSMMQGKPGMISFHAENIGYGTAKNLFFSLGGSLVRPVDCKVANSSPKRFLF